MSNMFGKYSADREKQQKSIEQTVHGKLEKSIRSPVPSSDKRTTLSLSLTVEDKVKLKMMAAKRNQTIAGMIHDWIAAHEG